MMDIEKLAEFINLNADLKLKLNVTGSSFKDFKYFWSVYVPPRLIIIIKNSEIGKKITRSLDDFLLGPPGALELSVCLSVRLSVTIQLIN